ncbi:MAG: 3-methyl-2-oxobutanoate hydroxymethyltransferase [Xanthomonadales bacterium]|nr:3-methyl-2-oxobutanoate hydroxymethyltransferase [Xanthomonadales bacterium]
MKVQDFTLKKQSSERISMVTCYDAWSAKLIAGTDIDCVLVGDSLAMVVYGFDTTLPVDIDTMAAHTAAVRRGAPDKFIIGDMPFLSYRQGQGLAVENAGKLMQAGANAVKLEGAAGNLDMITHLVESGIPVMGHLGLTPQSVHRLGGMHVQGRDNGAAEQLKRQATELQQAGCFALVLELVPAALAATVTQALDIPTVGIGAGAATDGQVLVLHDLLGLSANFKPKFLRTWMDGAVNVHDALQSFHREVNEGTYPGKQESYA